MLVIQSFIQSRKRWMMHTLYQDLQYAWRMLRKDSLLTAVIAPLAIGIGANAAIFCVVDALLPRPLPYPHPDRLAAIWLHSPSIGILRDWPSPGEYLDVQKENDSFEEIALAGSQIFVLTGRE
jgi:putative ABC transport system permease protein